MKWVRDQREERDPVKWLKDIIKAEEANLRRMQGRGTLEWLLVTNVPGTAHEDSGRIDRLNAHLLAEGKRLGLKMRAWWRNEVSRAVDSAPQELKFAYPDMLVGADIIRWINQTNFLVEKKNRLTLVLRSVAAHQRGQDSEVKFKHGELDGVSLNNLFIDVPIAAMGRSFEDRVGNAEIGTGVGLLTAPNRHNATVVLGAPGQGKSTLVQFVCQIHRSIFLSSGDDPLEAIGQQPLRDMPRIPYRLDLRIYGRWVAGYDPFSGEGSGLRRDAGAPTSVESFIARMMQQDSGGTEVSTEDVLFLLDWLPSFVAFDGLDEVAEVTGRQNVVDEIHAFQERATSYRGSTRIVVTSRPSYASAAEPRSDKFSYFELSPLTDALRNTYLERWISSQNLNTQDAADVRRVFKARSAEPHVSELATNPMQLAILLFLIYRRGESVPTNRTALYASYMELFLDRETSKNDVVKKHRHTVERVTAYIGWYLHADAESDGGTGRATRPQLIRLVKHRLADLDVDPSLATALFTAVTQRVWVLSSRTGEYFEFEVQPIREYFAAKHLFATAPATTHGDGVDRFDRMLALMHRPYWLNVTRFMAGMFDDGMISTVADKIEDLFESAPRPFWSRLVAKILLQDGIFDSAVRPRRRIVEGAFDAVGVIESAARLRSRPRTGSEYGIASAKAIDDLLRSSISSSAQHPSADRLARVLREISPSSAREMLIWWTDKFSAATDDKSKAAWLALIGPLNLARVISADQAQLLANSVPSGALLLLNAGVNAEKDSPLSKVYLDLITSGSSFRPRGTSLAALLGAVCDPFFLYSRGRSADEANSAEPLDIEQRPVRFPLQSSALSRLKSMDGLGSKIHDVLQITAGRRGTTLMWSQLGSAIEEEVGANWLSNRVVISAASLEFLTLGIASHVGEVPRTAFGLDRASSALLGEIIRNRKSVTWWRESIKCLEDPLDTNTWILGLISCADASVLEELLDDAAPLVDSLSDFELRRILFAIRDIARTKVVVSPYLAATAANLSPSLATLMLPLCPLGALGFGTDALKTIRGKTFLLEAFVRAYWAVRDKEAPVTEEELALIAECSPDFHLNFKIDYEQHMAEYVASEPNLYPIWALVCADTALSKKTKMTPLKDVAEKQDWFLVPD
ncbi:hypothetical protein J2T22_004257 [Pseudarthrobacter defluvii]|uniref:NACHT domain-containing protein n=1 Tax=Pseudarthrobacter defluvii TaxID=410837 RepID=A0ABT9URE6_9MICC|nr:hypothetical protein [Pseudarthrobacter defluvii]MDQ0121044.1 hypothetical protein [Pseudarthrobacter defluvii]